MFFSLLLPDFVHQFVSTVHKSADVHLQIHPPAAFPVRKYAKCYVKH